MDNNNNNALKNVATTGFSLLSFKVKMIVLGVIIVLFLVILIPVIALSAVTGVNNTEKKGEGSSSSSGSTSGVVVSVDTKKYENGVVIFTFYAHMKDGSIAVNVGDRVVAGQVIGEMGRTRSSNRRSSSF